MPDLIAHTFWRCSSYQDSIVVPSSDGNGSYRVNAHGCECKGWQYRQNCRHYKLWAAETCGWNELIHAGSPIFSDSPEIPPACPSCGKPVEPFTEYV